MKGEIIVGVGAVVLQNNEILLVKRLNEPCKGCWAIPGGRIEFGEDLGEAAKRELFEETNIVAEPLGVIWVTNIYYKLKNIHYVIIDFLMKPSNINEIKPGTDASDARFFSINNPPHPITSSTKKLLIYLKRLIANNELDKRIIPW
ncbi:MAG: NUDIX hydrolase [Staphylothermus sp.]|nr:NUDIX hydrolase [Staphylothermus sp.]